MDPILRIGTYGTHIHKTPTGTFSFVGTVPEALGKTTCKTEANAIEKFIEFFIGMSADDQREHIGNLRNDIFEKIMNRAQQGEDHERI